MNWELFYLSVVSERVPAITPACMLVSPGSLAARPPFCPLSIRFSCQSAHSSAYSSVCFAWSWTFCCWRYSSFYVRLFSARTIELFLTLTLIFTAMRKNARDILCYSYLCYRCPIPDYRTEGVLQHSSGLLHCCVREYCGHGYQQFWMRIKLPIFLIQSWSYLGLLHDCCELCVETTIDCYATIYPEV